MAANLVGAVLQLRGLNPTEKLVLVALANHCNAKTGRCDPAIELIADEAGVGQRQVFRILDRLTTRGLLIRHSGKGRGQHNRYAFPPNILGQRQATLFSEKGDTSVTEGGMTSPRLNRVTPMSWGSDTHVTQKGNLKGRKGSIPYGRLDAAAAYRQALADLPQNGNHQGQVAILVDFTRAHCPVAAVPGRLAALVRDYPAEDVLHVIWQAIPKDRPLDYAQATLKHKAKRAGSQRSPPPETDFSEYERESRQGKPHTLEEDQ